MSANKFMNLSAACSTFCVCGEGGKGVSKRAKAKCNKERSRKGKRITLQLIGDTYASIVHVLRRNTVMYQVPFGRRKLFTQASAASSCIRFEGAVEAASGDNAINTSL